MPFLGGPHLFIPLLAPFTLGDNFAKFLCDCDCCQGNRPAGLKTCILVREKLEGDYYGALKLLHPSRFGQNASHLLLLEAEVVPHFQNVDVSLPDSYSGQ